MAAAIEAMVAHRFQAAVEIATDCESARGLLEREVFDIITLDIQLPDGSGLDFLARLDQPHPPVIIVTGVGTSATASEAFALGAAGYVEKGKNLAALLPSAIEAALREQKLEAALEALSSSREQLQFVMDMAPSAMVVLDSGGVVTYTNREAERILHVPRDAMVGRSYEENRLETSVLPDRPGSDFIRILEGALREGRSARGVRIEMVRPDGSPVIISVNVGPRLDPSGRVNGAIVSFSDVTDRVMLFRALEAQRDAIYLIMESRGLGEICSAILEGIIKNSSFDSGAVHVLNDETGCLEMVADKGLSKRFADAIRRIEPGSEMMETALLITEPRFNLFTELPGRRTAAGLDEGLKATGVVPVLLEGRFIGCVEAASHTEEDLSDLDREIAGLFARAAGRAIVQARMRSAVDLSEQRFRRLHDNAGEAIFTYGLDLRIMSANRAACEHSGFSEEQLLGMHVFDIIDPEDIEKARPNIADHLAGGPATNLEVRIKTKDGRRLVADTTSTPLVEGGRVVGVMGIARDVTERIEVQEKLQALNGCLLSLGADAQANIEFLIARGSEILGGVELEYLRLREGQSDLVIRSHSEMNDSQRVTHQIDVSGQPVAQLRAYASQMTPEGMELLGLLARAVSIEEERWHRENTIRDFVEIASHELRHPITIIKGYAMTLQHHREELSEADTATILGDIDRGVDRLTKLVTQLMDSVNLEPDKLLLNRQVTDIRGLVERTVRQARARFADTEFAVSADDGIPAKSVDPVKVGHALANLLENAVNYSPAGSPVEVLISMNHEVRVSVLDRGPGVPEEDRGAVFERFYKVGEVEHHSIPGIGLGLYIAKCIIEAHDGRIWNEARDGGGSAFCFTIP